MTMTNGHGVNILDKTDKEILRSPSGKTEPKRTRYKWTSESEPGEFRMIHKSQLNIDGRYQREQVSQEKVMQIARDWDWLLYGVLSVIEREDHTLWVFDGGHRTRASFFRDDVTSLPCLVHQISDVSAEARAFVGRNTMVSNVSAMSRHNASVCGDEPIALKVQSLIERCGLRLAKTGSLSNGADVILCIGELTKCVGSDEELTERVLLFLKTLTDDKPISGMLVRGLFTLCKRVADRFDVLEKYGEKIARHSQKEIEIKIRQFRAECGQGGCVVEAKAILGLINKGNKIRIEW